MRLFLAICLLIFPTLIFARQCPDVKQVRSGYFDDIWSTRDDGHHYDLEGTFDVNNDISDRWGLRLYGVTGTSPELALKAINEAMKTKNITLLHKEGDPGCEYIIDLPEENGGVHLMSAYSYY